MSDDYIPLVLSSDDDEIIEIMQTPPTPRPEARPSRVLPPSTRLQIQINGVREAISELDGYIEPSCPSFGQSTKTPSIIFTERVEERPPL
jgi:hypothetical protein